MTSVSYSEVYSRFYTKVEAYDLIDKRFEDVIGEFMCNWLRSAIGYPHIRKIFSSISMDDELETITYELAYSIDELSDSEFVLDLLSYGMVYGWVQPKVNSITNIVQTFGTQDEKFFSQAAHLSELRALRDDTEKKIRDLTSSRGFMNNIYLDGKAASASLRKKT